MKPEFLVHYDASIRFQSSDKDKCNKKRAELKKEWPDLNWQVSTIKEYGHFCYKLGHDDGSSEAAEDGGYSEGYNDGHRDAS